MWLFSSSEPQTWLILESVPSVVQNGRGPIPFSWLSSSYKKEAISKFQLENTRVWVPSLPCCFLSSHTRTHMVWRLFAFDERHEEPGTVQSTWEKVPHGSVVHQSPSDGDRRCHSRQQVTERVPLICMHTQLYLVHIPHLLKPTEHVSSGITYTICRMAMQEKSMATAHAELRDLIWKENKFTFLQI